MAADKVTDKARTLDQLITELCLHRSKWSNHLLLEVNQSQCCVFLSPSSTISLFFITIKFLTVSGVDPGACFNKHDGLSDQATDRRPMLFVHRRMVRRPVGWSVVLIETAPRNLQGGG